MIAKLNEDVLALDSAGQAQVKAHVFILARYIKQEQCNTH